MFRKLIGVMAQLRTSLVPSPIGNYKIGPLSRPLQAKDSSNNTSRAVYTSPKNPRPGVLYPIPFIHAVQGRATPTYSYTTLCSTRDAKKYAKGAIYTFNAEYRDPFHRTGRRGIPRTSLGNEWGKGRASLRQDYRW